MFKLIKGKKDSGLIHGFKIHVSATRLNYQTIFQLVYPLLIQEEVTFKYIEKDEDVLANFSESESPAESGKYFTIYPVSREHCIALLELLYVTLPADLSGIYILSDRSYKDSQTIFYRYGFFQESAADLVEGIPTLNGPNGEVWQDYQKPYFDLPAWVDDLQDPILLKESYLAQRYDIIQLFGRSNGGNIYKARDKDSQKMVVIKETRPNIIAYGSVEKKDLRENEYRNAEQLWHLEHTPKPVEHATEWINDYYIYDFIEGQSLRVVSDSFSLFSCDSTQPAANRKKFHSFLQMAEEILTVIQLFHQSQYCLNDIHADNFIQKRDGSWYFVDLENTYRAPEDNLTGIYNEISLKEWNQLDGRVADCHKVGNLFLFLLGRLQVTSQEGYKPELTDDLLAYYGIASSFSTLISYLFSEEATIVGAIQRLNELSIEKTNRQYELAIEEVGELSDGIPIDYLLDEVALQPYLKAAQDHCRLQTLVAREYNLGLDGLSGVLALVQLHKLPASLVPLVKQKIMAGIVETEYGKSLSYGEGYASPYLRTGAAGFLKTLLCGDPFADRLLIADLTTALLVEFAQHSDYRNGLLGISDVLLDVYETFGGEEILSAVEKQLLTTGIKAQYDSTLQSSHLYLLARYRRLQNGIIFKKQAV